VENVKQLIGFKCHVCLDRTAPICPHMKINALSRPESNAANECAEELSNPVSLQPLSEVCFFPLLSLTCFELENEMVKGQMNTSCIFCIIYKNLNDQFLQCFFSHVRFPNVRKSLLLVYPHLLNLDVVTLCIK